MPVVGLGILFCGNECTDMKRSVLFVRNDDGVGTKKIDCRHDNQSLINLKSNTMKNTVQIYIEFMLYNIKVEYIFVVF